MSTALHCSITCKLIESDGRRLRFYFPGKKFESIFQTIDCSTVQTLSTMRTCAICFEPLDLWSKSLECGHTFHRGCLNNWIGNNPTCPECRRPTSKQYKVDEHAKKNGEGLRPLTPPSHPFLPLPPHPSGPSRTDVPATTDTRGHGGTHSVYHVIDHDPPSGRCRANPCCLIFWLLVVIAAVVVPSVLYGTR